MNDYLTAEEIAASSGKSMHTVYRLACEYRWRRVRTRPRGYLTLDVLATLAVIDRSTVDAAK